MNRSGRFSGKRGSYSITVEIEGPQSENLRRVLAAYNGSDAGRTRSLYAGLASFGPAGSLAVNLMRAQKTSARAKVYRGGDSGGRYSAQAYEAKEWAMGNLCQILVEQADALGIVWGWQTDPGAAYHAQVLYVVLPDLGQASFHTLARGAGPEFPGTWDGVRGKSAERILRFAAGILDRGGFVPKPAEPPSGAVSVTRGLNDDGSLRVFHFASQSELDLWRADNPLPEC